LVHLTVIAEDRTPMDADHAVEPVAGRVDLAVPGGDDEIAGQISQPLDLRTVDRERRRWRRRAGQVGQVAPEGGLGQRQQGDPLLAGVVDQPGDPGEVALQIAIEPGCHGGELHAFPIPVT